jgi:hypothetical protein
MVRTLIGAFLTVAAFGQKMEPAGAPPAEVAPAVAGVLNKEGAKILNADGSVFCEVWFRSGPPPAAKSAEPNVTMAIVAHGALLGVIRFPKAAADRRGITIKPGLYTLRFSFYPENGDHQGVAPQRDFLILSPAAADQDPDSTPAFDPLMDMSRKASGTPHPASLSCWKVDTDFKPGFEKMGEHDWVLQTKIGGIPAAVILIGKAEG